MHSHAMSALKIYLIYDRVSETWNWGRYNCIHCNFNRKCVTWKIYNLIPRCSIEKEPASPKKKASSRTDGLITRSVAEIYVFVINVNKLANVWLIKALKFREFRPKDVYPLSHGHFFWECEGMLLRLFLCIVSIESVHIIWRVIWMVVIIDHFLLFSLLLLLKFYELYVFHWFFVAAKCIVCINLHDVVFRFILLSISDQTLNVVLRLFRLWWRDVGWPLVEIRLRFLFWVLSFIVKIIKSGSKDYCSNKSSKTSELMNDTWACKVFKSHFC